MPDTTKPPFDPNKPYTRVSDSQSSPTVSKPAFDPNKPYTPAPVSGTPSFPFNSAPVQSPPPQPPAISIVNDAPQASVSGSAQAIPSGGQDYNPQQPSQTEPQGPQRGFWSELGRQVYSDPNSPENIKNPTLAQKFLKPLAEADWMQPIIGSKLAKEVAEPIGKGINQGLETFGKGVQDFSESPVKGTLEQIQGLTGTAFNAIPAAMEFNAVANAIKTTDNPNIKKAVDYPFEMAHNAANIIGVNPKEGSNADMLLSILDMGVLMGSGLYESKLAEKAEGPKIATLQQLTDQTAKVADGTATPEEKARVAGTLENMKNVSMNDIAEAGKNSPDPVKKAVADKIEETASKINPSEEQKHDLLYDFVKSSDNDPNLYKQVSDQIKSRADANDPADAEDLQKLNHYEDTYNQLKPRGLNDDTNKEILQTSWEAQQQIKLKKLIEQDENWKDNANKVSDHDEAVSKFNELKNKINDLKSGRKEVLQGDHYTTVYDRPDMKKPEIVVTPKESAFTEQPVAAFNKLIPSDRKEVEIHHGEDNLDKEGRVGGDKEPTDLEPQVDKEANYAAIKMGKEGVTRVETSPVKRAIDTADKIQEKSTQERLGGRFQFPENKELSAWDIGDKDTGFETMKNGDDGFKKVEDYFQDHPNETKLPDDFFAKDSEYSKYNGRSVNESWENLVNRLVNERNRLVSDPNAPATVAMLTHSKNMKILDAMHKNGGEWNEKAKQDYRNDNVESLKIRVRNPEGSTKEEPASEKASKPIQISTKNAVTKALQEGTGLPPIEIPKDRSEDASLAAWKDGTRNPNEIVDQLLSGEDIYNKSITPNDEPIMREYIRQLQNRSIELNEIKHDLQELVDAGDSDSVPDLESTKQQMLNHYDELGRALNASQLAGNIWHKFGMERQITVDEKGDIVNSIDRINTIYGNDVPVEVRKQLSDIQHKYDELLTKNQKIEKRLSDLEAQKAVIGQRGKIFGLKKKSAAQFGKERKDILADMKEALRKTGGQTYATVPGLPQLGAIAPHVLRLVKSLAEEGITKLDDVLVKVHDSVKDVLEGISKDDIRDIIAGKHAYNERNALMTALAEHRDNKEATEQIEHRLSELKTKQELNKSLSEIRKQAYLTTRIEALEKGIVAETKKRGESSPQVKELSRKLADAKKQSSQQYANVSAVELKKQADTISRKIEKGEFFKLPIVKRTFENDPQWIKNNKEKSSLKEELRNLETEAFNSQKNKFMKVLDVVNRWGRRVIFFGSNAVYTKLASAAVLGSFIHRVPEQFLGKAYIRAFPEIASRATMEGNFNAISEGIFYREFLNPKKFVKNTYDIGKTGGTELSRDLGSHTNEHHIPIIDLFAADTHIMIKDPVKRATFEAALNSHLAWYANNGIDGTHPLMLESARQAAYKRAEYEIFQDSKNKANKINEFFNELEKSGILEANTPGVGKSISGTLKYTAASVYHFLVPVNTVPLNILKRVGLGLMLPTNILRAIAKNKDLRNGFANMDAAEANLIMTQLKKGQIGAAYWTMGLALGGSFAGGLWTKYDPDKKRGDRLKADEMNILGTDISKNVQHNTQLTSWQMGATWRGVYDHYIDDKGMSQWDAIEASTLATTGTLKEKIPMVDQFLKLTEATQSESGRQHFEKDMSRRVGIQKAKVITDMMGWTGDENK
jgi:broad specificity phosphatase PhoE